MCLISVIIPFYNNEKDIEQCINTVQLQSLQELEILCIDDGSADLSAEIIEKLAKEDSRIKIWKQENRGPGAARNFGMKAAAGDYLIFLDADDYWVDRDALAQMHLICEENGIRACGSRMILRTGENEEEVNYYGMNLKESLENQRYSYRDYQFDFGFTGFLFHRQSLTDKNILFPELRRFEDPPFLVCALTEINDFMMTDCLLYCYQASNTGSKISEASAIDLLRGLIWNLNYARIHSLDILFKRTVNHIEYDHCRMFLQHLNRDMMNALLEADKMIYDEGQAQTRMIRPLEIMCSQTRETCNNYDSFILSKIEKTESLSIFGAGAYAAAFIRYLCCNNYGDKIKYILVTTEDNNPKQVEGIPVVGLNSKPYKDELEAGLLFVAAGSQYYKEIEWKLREHNFHEIEFLDNQFLYEITG